jgi:uncharacterized protein YgiM (DUF1202 family)
MVAPLRYEPVSHILVHHTETQNQPVDVPGAIRAIYYYHAIEVGWGDIGYNYLVDHNGRIYEGRFGGQDVVGHHAYDFANGSSGISVIGNFHSIAPTAAARSALVSICAWVGRDLDPLGASDFHTAPDLPTIASHRDATNATCPGNGLWNLLPELRQLVANTLDSGQLETGLPAGIVPGDRVKVQTDDGSALNLRSTANGTVTGSLANGALAWVIDGPTTLASGNWYRLEAVSNGATGWASAEFLNVAPPAPIEGQIDEFSFGLNLQVTVSEPIRRAPDTSAGIVATAAANAWAYVVEGSARTADGFVWYPVRVLGYGMGWMTRGSLRPAPVSRPSPARFGVDNQVEASRTLELRPRAGAAQPVMTTVPAGTRMVVTQPAVQVTGTTWYGVYIVGRGGAWVPEDGIRLPAPPPPAKFALNDAFRVTSATNLRSSPGTAFGIVRTMAVGATGVVIGGPRAANGYTWWQVRLSGNVTGWCIENWLVKTTTQPPPPPPTAKFTAGNTFRVSAATNLRTAATTAAGIIQLMAVGVTGAILGGPATANGYTWWNVRLSTGTTGWCIENWLVKTTAGEPPPPPPPGGLPAGTIVQTTANLRLRAAASTGATILAVLPAGHRLTIVSGPTLGSGYDWYRVTSNTYGTGYVADDFIVRV